MTTIEDKWDRGRVIIVGGSQGTTFTVKNSAEAAMRSGCGVVVAVVRKDIVETLERTSGTFKIGHFDSYTESEAAKVADLVTRSKSLVCGMGIEDEPHTILPFFKTLIEQSRCSTVIDADVTQLLANNRNVLRDRPNLETPHVVLMNRTETENYFGAKTPDTKVVAQEARETNSWFVLKSRRPRIISPNKEIIEPEVAEVPQMANAGSGDVLSGLLGGMLAQGFTTRKAILLALQIRTKAAQHYLRSTKDKTAQPQDIIRSIPFIWSQLEEYE